MDFTIIFVFIVSKYFLLMPHLTERVAGTEEASRVLKVCVMTKMLSIPMPRRMKGMMVWAAE